MKNKTLNIPHTFSFLMLFGLILIFSSCEKDNIEVLSNDGLQARKAYTEKGYVELEINPIVKMSCYFDKWDKTIMGRKDLEVGPKRIFVVCKRKFNKKSFLCWMTIQSEYKRS